MNSAGFVYKLIEAEEAADGSLPNDASLLRLSDNYRHTTRAATANAWRKGDFTVWSGHGQLAYCAHTLRTIALLAVASTLTRQPGANRGLALFRRAITRAA